MSHASLLVCVEPKWRQDTIELSVECLMAPFEEGGKWFADGSRWDWFVIGGRYDGRLGGENEVKRRDLDLDVLRQHSHARLVACYEEAMSEPDSRIRSIIYGVEEHEDLDTYLARQQNDASFPYFHSCLIGREWHEADRMGWFGCETATECQRADPGYVGRCIHECGQTGARIVSWNEDPHWQQRFFDRFVRRLDPDTDLVVVDYHV